MVAKVPVILPTSKAMHPTHSHLITVSANTVRETGYTATTPTRSSVTALSTTMVFTGFTLQAAAPLSQITHSTTTAIMVFAVIIALFQSRTTPSRTTPIMALTFPALPSRHSKTTNAVRMV